MSAREVAIARAFVELGNGLVRLGEALELEQEAPAERAPTNAITTRVAAKRLSVHEDTIRAMCRDGKIRSIKVGKGEQYRIPESAIEKLLRADRTSPGPLPR